MNKTIKTLNKPKNNNYDKSLTHEYFYLLMEMQKMMSSKIDSIDRLLAKLENDNIRIKDDVVDIEAKSQMILDQIYNLTDNIYNDTKYENNLEQPDQADQIVSSNQITIPINIKKDHPFEMLINQFMGNQTIKQTKDQEIEDEEYDINENIYSDKVIKNIPELEEFSKVPTNISELIEFGLACETILENSKKKKLKLPNEAMTNELYEIDGKKYSIDLEKVVNLMKPLSKLNNMIGMKNVKESVFEMVLYYLQGFESKNQNMLHSVIEGPPGTGKTQVGKILAQIYCALGIIESSQFKYVKATDLIGDHVGATKHMTQRVIDEADGGVLFIDEAYALSSNDSKDPYGKECIDTLNFNLSEKKKKLIVIIAGYPDHLDKYFFSFNPGLQRRFPFRHQIEGYSAEELRDIFIDKLKRFKWKLDSDVDMDELTKFFKSNHKSFTNFGGDIENLFKKCQYVHSNRVFGKNPMIRKILNMDDIQNGLKKLEKSKKTDDLPKYPHMYL